MQNSGAATRCPPSDSCSLFCCFLTFAFCILHSAFFPMTPSSSDLLPALGGELLAGSPATPIGGVASLAEAGEGDLSFFGNPKYLAALRRSRAAAVLVPRGFEPPEASGWTRRRHAARWSRWTIPRWPSRKLVERFAPPPVADAPGIAPTAVLGPRRARWARAFRSGRTRSSRTAWKSGTACASARTRSSARAARSARAAAFIRTSRSANTAASAGASSSTAAR